MNNQDLFKHASQIGPAIWLFTMYWSVSDLDEWPWFVVLNGKPVADAEAAAALGVSEFTAARWRATNTQRATKIKFAAILVKATRAGLGVKARSWRASPGNPKHERGTRGMSD